MNLKMDNAWPNVKTVNIGNKITLAGIAKLNVKLVKAVLIFVLPVKHLSKM